MTTNTEGAALKAKGGDLRDVPGYEGLYAVTNDGRVWSHRMRIWMKPSYLRGYARVRLCRERISKTLSCHRLVLRTFVGPCPDGNVVNHKNSIRDDNRLENLEYCTPSQNTKHSFAVGRSSLRGERNTFSVLTDNGVIAIRKRVENGEPRKSVAADFSVSLSTISRVVTRATWWHVGDNIGGQVNG